MSSKLYEFKVTFKYFSEVDTYRIFRVVSLTSLAAFGIAIVLSFNGDCSHLFQFRNNNQSYVIYNADSLGQALSAYDYTVDELVKDSNFYYDYGDGWEFGIELIRIYQPSEIINNPLVIEGNGLGIIEDIGGYAALSKAYKKAPKKFEKINIKNINLNIEMNVDTINELLLKYSGFTKDLLKNN